MSAASFFRRLIVSAMAITLAFLYIFVNFKGLTTADGMEKSQFAREISRVSYQTKMIRPVAIWQYSQKHNQEAFLQQVQRTDSYNSPLYPLVLGAVFKIIGADDFESWKMKEGDTIYKLDRVIVALSIFFFLIGVLIVYALARRVFDGTIAGMTFFVLMTCEMFWNFTHTGMPNCFMFMLFSGAMYFAYRATEASSEENGNGFVSGALAGILLVLLCLCHWMGVWILIGFIVYSFFFLRPMGGIAAVTVVVALLAFTFPVLQNIKQTGNPFGTAFYTLYAGLGASSDMIMRSGDAGDIVIPFRDTALKFVRNSIGQVTNVYEYIGYIIAAPLFFLSLIHSYKKKAVASFRWAILSMWFFAGIGMSIYGLGENAYYSNQIHYLFGGVMTIYGLSMVMILWMKLPVVRELEGIFKETHLIVLGALACAPMLLQIPDGIYRGLVFKKNFPNWPPYSPSSLNTKLNSIIDEDRYIFSDQPWAVAWYADRNAIWMPHNVETFKKIEASALSQAVPIAGVHVSPTSLGERGFYESFLDNRDMSALSIDGWAAVVTQGGMGVGELAKKSKDTSQIMTNYPYPLPLNGALMIYHAAEKPRLKN